MVDATASVVQVALASTAVKTAGCMGAEDDVRSDDGLLAAILGPAFK